MVRIVRGTVRNNGIANCAKPLPQDQHSRPGPLFGAGRARGEKREYSVRHSAARCIVFVMIFWPSAAYSQWISVGDGIDYQDFTAAGPNRLFVSRMARDNPNATIDTTIANNTISGAKEIVRNQAARQDDAITWWGGSWGARNEAVVAINGGFYNTTTGVIEGGQIQSGWYAHWFADRGAFSGFAWKTDRTAFHGECVDHTDTKVFVKFVATAGDMVIDGINRTPGTSDLVVFTPQYNTRTPTGSRTEVLVEMSRPNLTTSGGGYSSGIIRSVAQNTGSTWIPFDHLVLSAAGDDGTTLKNHASVGSEIRIFQELVETNQPDVQGNYACQMPTGVDWSNVFASINSNYHFLENNVVRVPDAVARPGYIGYVNLNPRTAICWNSSYVFFVICDGRSAQSVGMSCETLGNWAKSVLGATDGVNLDGGGSSTMVVNGAVMNVPSDGNERAVCNGVMMVNMQPKQQSTQLTTSQIVTTSGQANCRLGPGTNYGNISTLASGSQGIVVAHAINGVYAKGLYWWKCNFGGTVGWVSESLLIGGGVLPTIVDQPSSQTLAVGGTAIFAVTASGSPTLAYQWQKNQTNLSNGGHYSGATTATLTISNADINDVAGYRCVVSNAYGTATSNEAALTLSGQPTITQHPMIQNVCVGEVATFTIAASSDGSPTYRWQKNGANLSDGGHYSGTTTPAVTISNADSADVGSYRCVVTNAAGSTTSNSAPLAIDLVYAVVGMGIAGSTITGTSNDGSVVSGNSPSGGFIYSTAYGVVGLGAGTTTAGVATKNGAVVAGGLSGGNASRWDGTAAGVGTWTTLPLAEGTTAWTPLCTSAQNGSPGNTWIAGHLGSATGTRQAVAYNEVAGSTSILTLPANGKKDALIYGVSDTGSYAGQYQYGNVSPSGARQAMGGSPLTALSPIIGAPSTKNEGIAKAVSRDGTKAGGWSWSVASSSQCTIWTIANPTVPYAVPFIGDDAYGEIQALNSNGSLAAGYAAGGSAGRHAIIWDATNGTRDLQAWLLTQYGLSTAGWTFTDVKAMSGDGKVMAGNGVHNGITEAWVVLLGMPGTAPTVTAQPATQTLCPGASASFTVTANGLGAMRYQWQKNGTNLTDGADFSGTSTAELSVSSVDFDDAADYRCVVSVGCNSTTSEPAALTVKASTAITQQPTALIVSLGAAAQFTVSAAGEGPLSYQWRQNGTPLTEGGRYSGTTSATLVIDGVETSDAANYSCVVTGGCGSVTSDDAALTLSTTVHPDLDSDGDVDQADFVLFDLCFSGPAVPLEPGCENRDFDSDNDVDQSDFGIFQRCYSGEDVPLDPACASLQTP